MSARVVGFDLSLVATGAAAPESTVLITPGKLRDEPRLAYIRDAVLDLLRGRVAPLAVIEGLSFGSHTPSALERAGLHYIVRVALRERGIPFVVVAPTSLKKFATGAGNANKDAMIAAAIRRFGFEGCDNNEADAYLLRCMGLAAYGLLDVTLPKPHMDALAKVDWPERRAAS